MEIDLINKQQSDVVLFTGDLVNNKAEEVLPWIRHFSKIAAPQGVYSVLGIMIMEIICDGIPQKKKKKH